MTGSLGWSRQEREGARAPVDNAGRRQFALAQEKDVHDERLWMGITKATGALGNTSCLVGTAEQVADSLLAYYRLGVSSFLMRGFDPVNDTIEFGRDLIPRLRAGVLEIDRRQGADAGRSNNTPCNRISVLSTVTGRRSQPHDVRAQTSSWGQATRKCRDDVPVIVTRGRS